MQLTEEQEAAIAEAAKEALPYYKSKREKMTWFKNKQHGVNDIAALIRELVGSLDRYKATSVSSGGIYVRRDDLEECTEIRLCVNIGRFRLTNDQEPPQPSKEDVNVNES